MAKKRIAKLGLSLAAIATMGMLNGMPAYAEPEAGNNDDGIIVLTESEYVGDDNEVEDDEPEDESGEEALVVSRETDDEITVPVEPEAEAEHNEIITDETDGESEEDGIAIADESENEIHSGQITQYAVTTGKCGNNASYTLDDNGVLTITGTGVVTNNSGPQFRTLPIQKVIIPEGVTGIRSCCFAECKELEEVSFPSTLTSIELMAFTGCSNLKEVILPEGLTTLEYEAFCGCESVERVVIPGSLSTIGNSAFVRCSSLKELTISEGVTEIGARAFCKCGMGEIHLPDSLINIGEEAFFSCRNLKSVTIPKGVSTIQKTTFCYCTGLEEVNIPDTVTVLEENVFSNCTSLEELTIPGSVKIIPSSTTKYSGVKKVTLGYGVTTIEEEAFLWSTSLEEVIIPESVTTIGDDAFGRCDNLKKMIIPDSVTYLGHGACLMDGSLKEIQFPANLTEIGVQAFRGCQSLEKVTVPDHVSKIWFDAFTNCTKLESIEIPKSLTEVGENAFNGCYRLKDVYYAGNEAEWNGIRIEVNNDPLKYATIHFNDGTSRVYVDYSREQTTRGFVYRMYDVVLGRQPDEAGMNDWVERLNSGRASAVDIVYGFFYSPEYQNRGKSNEDIVADCYYAMLGREPDYDGYQDWVNKLDIGMTPEAIFAGFVGSMEFTSQCSYYGINPGQYTLMTARDQNYERTYFVYRLYRNCLGRTPETAGQENWCAALGQGMSGTEVAAGFVFSAEYTQKNASNEEYVAMLYQTILGREGEQAGMSDWIGQLNNGASREHILNGFLYSREFAKQCEVAGIHVGSPIAEP